MSGVYDEIRNLDSFVLARVPEEHTAYPTTENAFETRFSSRLYSKEIRQCTFCVDMHYK